MHVSRIDPAEERLAGRVLALYPVLGGADEFVVASFHPLLSQRPGVLDLLFAYATPPRLLCWIVCIGSPTVQYAARAESFAKVRKVFRIRPVGQLRLFFCIQVIEVAEELI